MERKGEDFLALQEYVTAKATLLERLAQMEAKRDKIKPVLFEKIRSDYEGQLKKLVDDFRPVRIRVIQKLGDFEQELAQVEKKLTFAQDKVIELRFRHQLGEYDEDEFRRMEYEHLAQVDHVQATWDELNVDLEDYRNLIGDDKDFQRRFAYEEAPGISEPAEESYEPEVTEPAEPEPVAPPEDVTMPYETMSQAREPGAGGGPIAANRELPPARRAAKVGGYFAMTPDTEETEENTESTQDTALMDDEELFGQYYKEHDSETMEMAAVDGYEGGVTDDSGTMEMPAVVGADGFSTEDSSTGVWSAEAVLAPLPPPPAPPTKAPQPLGAAPKVAASFLGWKEPEEDDKDSTMVWGAVPVQEVQAAAAAAAATAAPPPKSLIFRDKKNSKEVAFPLGRNEISIGRSQDNDIVLTEGKISRRHAKVQFADGGFLLSDLNSSNGTFVNGKKIARPVMLRDNDEILIGDSSMTFR